jgi:hypothetical protein
MWWDEVTRMMMLMRRREADRGAYANPVSRGVRGGRDGSVERCGHANRDGGWKKKQSP